ncbi:hypothetical protein TNCV_2955341 [Trichonephila clavipes]|nr:hypothetical protein TNCV_2955341 [Trichonephila clavipes]
MRGVAPSCIKIMRERHLCACGSGIILFRNNDAYRCPMIEQVPGPPTLNSSKKYSPRIKDAETHTTPLLLVSVAELVRWNAGCLLPKFGSCEYSPNRPNESVFLLSRGYSKAILDQLPNERETAVRTDVKSRNHVEAIPAQVEACMDSNGGCFA